jgi:plastocyanin
MFRLFAVVSLVVAVSLLTASGLNATGGGGRGCHQPLTHEHTSDIKIESYCYSPTIVRVQPGVGVSWTNRDDAPHNIIGAGGSWGGGSHRDSNLLRGSSFGHTFEAAGIFPYYCSLHPGMVGVVAVGDFEASEAIPDQALQLDAAAATSGAGGDRLVPLMALSGVGIGVTLAMVGNAIVRNRRDVRTKRDS